MAKEIVDYPGTMNDKMSTQKTGENSVFMKNVSFEAHPTF